MISRDDVIQVGKTLRPHGLKGELSASTEFDIDFDALRCIVLDIDGILVPFFIESWRTKSADVSLLTIDGIDDDTKASALSNKEIYILATDAEKAGLTTDDDDVLYFSELPGFTIMASDGEKIGIVRRVDDSTSNVVLSVETPTGEEVLIPFAEEFVEGIDKQNKLIMLDLPDGILDLNR